MNKPNQSLANNQAYLRLVLRFCGNNHNLEDAWRNTEPRERLAVIDELLNLVPVLERCKFEDNPFIINHDGDVVEELRMHWSYDDYGDLPDVLKPFLSLALHWKQAMLSAETVCSNVNRFKIGLRKYST